MRPAAPILREISAVRYSQWAGDIRKKEEAGGTPEVPFQDANLSSIHDQRSAIILFRVHSGFNIF
jgi:hypothetical protein